MEMTRIIVSIPRTMKVKLDALRADGITAAGLIRHLLSQHFNERATTTKRRA